jgi:riboflavin synthase
MFTGIVETLGTVVSVRKEGTNSHLQFSSPIGGQLKVDQSVSHNGVCLTVVNIAGDVHSVVAIHETLIKSNLGTLHPGDKVNLERCMAANGRFDGHIVQGHVDQTALCTSVKDENGSWLFNFDYDPREGNVTVEKGSVCINGVSLTCFNTRDNGFSVAIIPYTFENTNFNRLKKGDTVNLEFDIVGKYVQRLLRKSAV